MRAFTGDKVVARLQILSTLLNIASDSAINTVIWLKIFADIRQTWRNTTVTLALIESRKRKYQLNQRHFSVLIVH